jgi:hypothetical protein
MEEALVSLQKTQVSDGVKKKHQKEEKPNGWLQRAFADNGIAEQAENHPDVETPQNERRLLTAPQDVKELREVKTILSYHRGLSPAYCALISVQS